MNAPAIQPAFASKLEAIADTFTAWRVTGGKSHPLEISAATLTEATEQALHHCQPRDTLLILATAGLSGRQTLHSFTVKKSTKRYFYRASYDGGPQVRVAMKEALAGFAIEVERFAPVEPFRWSPGCDVVGVDRSVVEQRS